MTRPTLVERLKALLVPKHQTSRAKADESTIKLRKSRDEVQLAVARLSEALKDHGR